MGLPIVAHSVTAPKLSNHNAFQSFYRMLPSDTITVRALIKLFQKYDWRSTNVINQGDTYEKRGLETFTEVFKNEVKIIRMHGKE